MIFSPKIYKDGGLKVTSLHLNKGGKFFKLFLKVFCFIFSF